MFPVWLKQLMQDHYDIFKAIISFAEELNSIPKLSDDYESIIANVLADIAEIIIAVLYPAYTLFGIIPADGFSKLKNTFCASAGNSETST